MIRLLYFYDLSIILILVNNAREEVNKTHQAYKEVFGYSPPQSIWPDMSSGDVSLYPTFIRINLFNTFCWKFLVMTCNKNLNDESISTPVILFLLFWVFDMIYNL